MSDSTDDADADEDLPEEADQVPEAEKADVVEEHQDAGKAAEEQRIEEEKARSRQRENDAEEIANPDKHRDEAPEVGGN